MSTRHAGPGSSSVLDLQLRLALALVLWISDFSAHEAIHILWLHSFDLLLNLTAIGAVVGVVASVGFATVLLQEEAHVGFREPPFLASFLRSAFAEIVRHG